ncbi:MAG: hypothetical protein WCO60_16935, partial [Verrucomicrobiota bacterium]
MSPLFRAEVSVCACLKQRYSVLLSTQFPTRSGNSTHPPRYFGQVSVEVTVVSGRGSGFGLPQTAVFRAFEHPVSHAEWELNT